MSSRLFGYLIGDYEEANRSLPPNHGLQLTIWPVTDRTCARPSSSLPLSTAVGELAAAVT